LDGAETEFQGSRFQSVQQFLNDQVVQRRRRDATATLPQIRTPILVAEISRSLAGLVACRQAMTTRAAYDQALQQSGATLRRSLRIVQRSILLEALLIGEVLTPRDVSRQSVAQQHRDVLGRHEPLA